MMTEIDNVADIGTVIRRARTTLGLTQDVLAAAAGVGTRFVVELEAGKPTVQMDKVLAVLAALDLTLAVRDRSA